MYNIATPLPVTKLLEQVVDAGIVPEIIGGIFYWMKTIPAYRIYLRMRKNGVEKSLS